VRLVVVFEHIAAFPGVKHRLLLRNDCLCEVEDSFLTIPVTLDKEDPLLAAEQRVLCLFAFLVNNDKLVVFCGYKRVGSEAVRVLDQGHVNDLLCYDYLVHTEITRLVGEVK
jgi:hypothetical protein